jgi:radical SAM protein with 4Fe4S-binding SPASM domain
MAARSTVTAGQASSCYFRTTTDGTGRKALVQIDERCNLHCAHCFVSATKVGRSMPVNSIVDVLIPRLADCRVERVTVGGVHANVSLDGFRPESHGKFRGDRDSFHTTIGTVRELAAAGLLQGLLCTPNSLAEDAEYRELCEFAVEQGARYVLMNPLSSMGRGVRARAKLASAAEHMRHIHQLTAPFDGTDLDVVHIRFPNTEGKPLAGCEAGTIIYVFTAGEVTVCPYLVFAARTPQSQHDPAEFIVGNIFTDPDIADRLDAYHFHDRYQVGANPTCRVCSIAGDCGKGCPAAVIASGQPIGAVDADVCPVTAGARPLLSMAPV